MASYQDLAQKIEILEDKLDLVMKSVVISQQVGKIAPKLVKYNLLDLYYATRAAGLRPADSNIPPLAQTVGEEVI